MTAIVTQGDAAHLHLPDASVDLVITSPPYFGLRSYTDGGQHYEGQVGAEATPAEYLDALIACTAEWMRVLKPGGSIFVNLGDKYSGAQQQNSGIPAKSLMLFPQRYAIRCIDELGLILRAEIVWAKPNGLPESVKDRVRRSHEQVFHFVKQPRYFSAVDEIREQYDPKTAAKYARGFAAGPLMSNTERLSIHLDYSGTYTINPLGKLPGSVWTIPPSQLRVPAEMGIEHFAAYPPELVRRIVLGWSPTGGLVLDPFAGTGTTMLVASVFGRVGIGVDLSADYCRLAQWRTTDEKQRAKVAALGKSPKPPKAAPAPAIDLPAPTLFDDEATA